MTCCPSKPLKEDRKQEATRRAGIVIKARQNWATPLPWPNSVCQHEFLLAGIFAFGCKGPKRFSWLESGMSLVGLWTMKGSRARFQEELMHIPFNKGWPDIRGAKHANHCVYSDMNTLVTCSESRLSTVLKLEARRLPLTPNPQEPQPHSMTMLNCSEIRHPIPNINTICPTGRNKWHGTFTDGFLAT
jgi:hypothetical protein